MATSLDSLSMPDTLHDKITHFLEAHKCEDICFINLMGKSTVADGMVIATALSQRHMQALAHQLSDIAKKHGCHPRLEGLDSSDWVLADCGDTIVHLFRGEARSHYNLEKMWQVPAGGAVTKIV